MFEIDTTQMNLSMKDLKTINSNDFKENQIYLIWSDPKNE